MCTQANANTTRAELIISNGFCKCVFKRWTQTPLFTPESWANLRTLSLGPLARWRPKAKGPYFACSEACCSTCCQRYIGHICPTLKNTGLGRLSLNASHSRSWHQMRTDSMSPQLKLFHPRGQQRCLFCPVPPRNVNLAHIDAPASRATAGKCCCKRILWLDHWSEAGSTKLIWITLAFPGSCEACAPCSMLCRRMFHFQKKGIFRATKAVDIAWFFHSLSLFHWFKPLCETLMHYGTMLHSAVGPAILNRRPQQRISSKGMQI